LTPHPKRRDWFAIPSAWLPEIAASPQVQLDARLGAIVHRSHLPLLAKTHPEVAIFLSDLGSLARLESDRSSDRAAFDAETDANGWKLRGYQHDGREFIRARRGTLLADSMRVGKTAQIIASHDEDLGPLFVVAPLATREVWLSWFKRRWPNVRPVVLAGRRIERANPAKPVKSRRDRGFDLLDGAHFDAQRLADAKLIFCNYDILGAWKELNGRRIGTFVLDEIHLVSQRHSRRAQAAVFAANLAERVIGATGTPIWNKPSGLFTTLSCLCPAAFGAFFDYASRFCDARPGSHGYVYDGASNEDEFRLRMSEIMLRRTWQDVSGELPAIDRSVEVVDVTEDQQFQIEKEAERVRDHAGRTTAIGALARFRRLLAKLKVGVAVDVSRRILQSGEKVIVWTWHRDIALKIEDDLAKSDFPGFVVSGSTPMNLREDILNRWRAHPGAAPLVITLSVGQVGIDLSAARYEVFAELDFTPSVVAQAEMRPFSPLRPSFATYVIIDHDVDRRILAALQDKCDTAFRMGVPAAESTIGVLASAFARLVDGPDDFDALAKAIMMEHPEVEDLDEGSNYHGSLWNYDWEAGE
jgi:SNF2 family DNA or RNA helicase